MADKHSVPEQDGCMDAAETTEEVISVNIASKKRPSTSPTAVPPHKSPRTDIPLPTAQEPGGGGQSVMDTQEVPSENTEGRRSPLICPGDRRKSWRRATITRRSLPALPTPYQKLCRSISISLSQQERLEKLMEASMRLAIERLQDSLHSVSDISPKFFQKQVENLKEEWCSVAKGISDELKSHQLSARPMDHAPLKDLGKIEAIDSLRAESESWEALLNKHRSKAEEWERKVTEGRKTVVLDATTMAQSSQFQCIQSKPDYHSLLSKQKPMLNTMTLIMDTQCKIVRELLSIKEQSQLMVKKSSSNLAAEAGFQDFSPDVISNLMMGPLPSTKA